jgi:aminoglycoside phosphotransferase family enzyme/predicted kinase
MSSLKEDLSGPGVELIETHTAWVFLHEDTVLKVKKPVDYGFLNFTTLERRKAVCDAEVRLNARLAPDVYRGVLPVTRDAAGRHVVDGDGAVVDYAVSMRRLPDAARADVLLGDGRLAPEAIDGLAEHLARFHESLGETTAAAAPFGTPEAIANNVLENFQQAHAAAAECLNENEAAEIEREQKGFLEHRRELLRRRIEAGRVRDGHGDLRLEHVYFESGGTPTVIDCLEFADRFRYADVCSDIAFLSMDLRRLGRADLAERLIASYARASGDYELYELVDFYEGYRAYVRGKVAALLAEDRGAELDVRDAARKDARTFFVLALLEGRQPLLHPALVAVGGLIASGKSTISERVGAYMNAPVVSADRTRKHLLGVKETEPVHDDAFGGAYSAETNERVYAEVFRRAGQVLGSRRPVVLDASFRSRELRARAQELARRHGVGFVFVECRTTPEEAKRRLAKRALAPSISDGRAEIYDDFAARFEPITELPPSCHFVLDTTSSVETALRPLLPALPTWSSSAGR